MPTALPTLDRHALDERTPHADAPPGCDACPHPVSAHDRIGLRFCRATLDSALARGCVCPAA
ncbi:RGCVC family protein [Geodermatophilus amargosae]|uniref:RGCVC family protein n=1 Tax=Geodermatophilus amargosae TaxID=1296565 RepID=UPI0034DE8128